MELEAEKKQRATDELWSCQHHLWLVFDILNMESVHVPCQRLYLLLCGYCSVDFCNAEQMSLLKEGEMTTILTAICYFFWHHA